METRIERVDELPLLVNWLQKMQIDQIVDHCLPAPHGNRQGLSYGQLSLLFLCYVLYLRTHKLCSMESWVESHQGLLCHLTGWELSRLDATDDRLGALLSCLVQSSERVEELQTQLSRHQVLAFELGENPVVRHDFTALMSIILRIITPKGACWSLVIAKTTDRICSSSNRGFRLWLPVEFPYVLSLPPAPDRQSP